MKTTETSNSLLEFLEIHLKFEDGILCCRIMAIYSIYLGLVDR